MQTKRNQKQQALPPEKRTEYIAVVRFPDGTRDTFLVRFAENIEDARELVRLEVGDVRTILIAEHG